jgi:hypothetical protein
MTVAAKPPPTHTALAYKREGRRLGRWLEVGVARAEPDGAIRVYLDRTPIGGFTGYVHLTPGVRPPPEPPATQDEETEPAA